MTVPLATSRVGLSICRSVQRLLDQDLVDVTSVDLRVLPRRADDAEPLSEVRLEGHRVVGSNEREDLLVALLSSRFERRGEEGLRHAAAPVRQIDIGSERANVIERPGVGRKRLEDLESNELVVSLPNRDLPHTARGEVEDVVALCSDAEGRV